MGKCFKLSADDIKPLIGSMGRCIASDRITVDGYRVGYMYRTDPVDPTDSGWCFFAGNETQAFVDEVSNFDVLDVNTVANYDAEIIPFLETGAPCAFERDSTGQFQAVTPVSEC